MNKNLSILFYAKRAKATTDGLIPNYLRVTINGQRFEISTKRYVEESKWSSKAGKIKSSINTEEAKSINSFIDTLRNCVYHLQKEIVQEVQPFNIETFKNKWLGISEKPRMLFEIFQHHNEQLKDFIRVGEFAAGAQQPKMNAYLKEIADICAIQKNFTFHMARHTFATTDTLSNNAPIETVSKMLGHKSLQQTQHYAKILDKKVSNDMQILPSKFAGQCRQSKIKEQGANL